MKNNNKEQISIAFEKKIWAMPELIVIDKKVIEGGVAFPTAESEFFGNES